MLIISRCDLIYSLWLGIFSLETACFFKDSFLPSLFIGDGQFRVASLQLSIDVSCMGLL